LIPFIKDEGHLAAKVIEGDYIYLENTEAQIDGEGGIRAKSRRAKHVARCPGSPPEPTRPSEARGLTERVGFELSRLQWIL